MSYGIWTNRECEKLDAMLALRLPRREIAAALNRSYNSVHGRIHSAKLLPKPEKPKPPRTAVIAKADVPDWYERGWRFAGFSEDGLCWMERA